MKPTENYISHGSHSLNSVIAALQTPPRLRSNAEIAALMDATASSEFFLRIFREYYNQDLHRLFCTYMTLEEVSKGNHVYKLGDPPGCLYFILSGSVSLNLPSKLVNIFSIPREYQAVVRNISKSSQGSDSPDFDIEEARIRKLFFDFLEKDLKTIEDLSSCKSKELKDLLRTGDSLGISGLFTNRLRSHNAVANEKVYLACITKPTFAKIVSAYNEKQINDRIEFLHRLQLFTNWSRISLIRLLEAFRAEVYVRNQRIFQEGETADFVVFIMQGEVKITKTERKSRNLIDMPKFKVGGQPLRLGKSRQIARSDELEIVVKGANQIIGIEDMGEPGKKRGCSCYCYSARTEALILSRQVFLERVNRPESMGYINNKKHSEAQWISYRVDAIKSVDVKIAGNEEKKGRKREKIRLRIETPKVSGTRFFEETSQAGVTRKELQSGEKKRRLLSAPVSPKKEESKRLPPPNFWRSYRKKMYSVTPDRVKRRKLSC
jgi:CRP-like cAMP-binding protein